MEVEWLVQNLERSFTDQACPEAQMPLGGDHDDGQRRLVTTEPAKSLPAVLTGKIEIEEDDVRPDSRVVQHGRLAAVDTDEFVPERSEVVGQELADGGVVLDDENPGDGRTFPGAGDDMIAELPHRRAHILRGASALGDA